MQRLAQISQHLGFVVLSFCILCFSVSKADPRTNAAALVCGNSTNTSPSMISNFNRLMNRLQKAVGAHMYAQDFISKPDPPILGFAQCHADLDNSECNTCFVRARSLVSTCRPATEGRVFLDGCFLRYDHKEVIDQFVDKGKDQLKCSGKTPDIDDQLLRVEFGRKVMKALQNVTLRAPKSKGFSVAETKGGVNGVYALAQCWNLINEDSCKQCLQQAGHSLMMKCVPGSEGRALNAGCYLRYSTKKFYGKRAQDVTHEEEGGTFLIVVCATAGLFFLLVLGATIGYVRLRKNRQSVRNKFTCLSTSISKSNINFKYEALEKATNFFDISNKLGQGGDGTVFKGTLPDGRTVAVKRLSFSTRPWVDEFFNEVTLISETGHKNLVKLYGCSIEGPESLLVYEYLPNKNLDGHLFDSNKTQVLSWAHRMGIVCGIADGLAYLHGDFDSPVKLIHRDIKSSNILLDENMVPKIADFGLVRSVPGDKSHISTGIAGTLGYMSPEYLVRGQLTEKADVYAFGVLATEIVSGKKNTVFMQSSTSILLTAWKYFKANNLSEAVDASLKGNFNTAEASKVLQIALLCTQTLPSLRPTMPEVAMMLNGTTKEIPMPRQPPFVNSSILGCDDTLAH